MCGVMLVLRPMGIKRVNDWYDLISGIEAHEKAQLISDGPAESQRGHTGTHKRAEMPPPPGHATDGAGEQEQRNQQKNPKGANISAVASDDQADNG